jgi:hypothetical protein
MKRKTLGRIAYEAAVRHTANPPGMYPPAWDRIANAVEKAVLRRHGLKKPMPIRIKLDAAGGVIGKKGTVFEGYTFIRSDAYCISCQRAAVCPGKLWCMRTTGLRLGNWIKIRLKEGTQA